MPGSDDTLLDKAESLARRVLNRIGSAVDDSQAPLSRRLEAAVEANLQREPGVTSPLSPNRFRIALTYEETSGFTEQYMKAMAEKLSGELQEYIVDRRYRSRGPIIVEIARDVLARETTIKASFDETGASAKQAADEPAVASRRILVQLPDGSRARLDLGGEGLPISIGRAAGSAVRLDDPSVSRTHCSLALKSDGRVVISDLGSANGTAINGDGLGAGESREIKSGDLVRVGDLLLAVIEVS